MTLHLRDFLRNHHPFVLLTPEEQERVSADTLAVTVATGTVIVRLGGEVSSCLHLVATGRVDLVRDGHTVHALEEGDCFGHPSIIGQVPPALEAVAREETLLYCVPAALFRQLIHTNAAFAEFFLQNLSERLQTATRRDARVLGGELTTPVGVLDPPAPVVVRPEDTVGAAARIMRDARVDVALVDAEPPGIVTDHDFRTRVLAEDRGPGTPIADIMTRPLKTLPDDALVHQALLFMLEEGIRHLPVVGDTGIRGILSATDLLRHQSRNPLYLMRQLDDLSRPESLDGYAGTVAAMVERLFHGGLQVGQIGRICASLNDTLVRRLLKLAEEELGPPPCAYAWLGFGSEGRMEQTLINDQDNALAWADDTPAAAGYFAQLGRHVVDHLIRAGFPPCPGGYMATEWAHPLGRWHELVDEWIGSPTPENMLVSAIFFDFRVLGGDLDVSPLAERIAHAGENQLFMAHLARAAQNWRTPLGMFRRLQSEDGQVDLKTGGIAALVGAARAYGLGCGTPDRSTRLRFEAAVAADMLSEDLGETAVETYRFLLQLRLREQLSRLREGGEPDNRIDLARLTSLEQRHLKDAFGLVGQVQDAVGRRFRTQSLG